MLFSTGGGGTRLKLNKINRGQHIFREVTRRRFVRQQVTRRGNNPTRNPTHVRTIPLHFLRLLRQSNGDVGYTYSSKRVTGNPFQSGGHAHVLRHHIAEIDVLNLRKSVGIVAVVGVGTVVAGHPEGPFHGGHGHSSDVDVPDETASADGGLDSDSGFGVNGDDVLGAHVLDSAGHFAAEGDDGAEGRDAGEASDQELFRWHSECDSVLVPPTLYCHAIVPRNYVTVLYSGVTARICFFFDIFRKMT